MRFGDRDGLSSSRMPALVFVYGTLMRGRANHDVMRRAGATFASAARTLEPRTLVDLGPYPALLAAAHGATCRIEGELFYVDADALEALDAFEGCPELYARETIVVEAERGPVEAFVYVLVGRAPADARVVEDGRYAGS